MYRSSLTHISTRPSILPMVNGALLALMVAAGLLLIWQVNRAATNGYRLRDLESQLSALQQQTQQLEVDVAHARSLERVERGVSMLGMVPASAPTYVRLAAPAVAFK